MPRTLTKEPPPTATKTSRGRPTQPQQYVIKFYEKEKPYYELTNFAPFEVEYEGKKYPTSEHLFQAFKFLGTRPDLAEHIRTASDRPGVAFSEAKRFAPERRTDWLTVNVDIMDLVLEKKFTQHRELTKTLLDTGDAYLIEDAGKNDDFWGNGEDGQGQNHLGMALMRIRKKLRDERSQGARNTKYKA